MTNISEIEYAPMSLERHDRQQVASLICESAPELFSLMLGSQAIAHLTHLISMSANCFSHQYIRLAHSDRRVVGIAILVPAEKVKTHTDFTKVLTIGQIIRLSLVQNLLLRYVLQHDYPNGTFYLSNLAVAPEYRDRGIGTQLLLNCIEEASTCSDRLFISVDINNPRAYKLYRTLGFEAIATKKLFGTQIGSRVLSRSL